MKLTTIAWGAFLTFKEFFGLSDRRQGSFADGFDDMRGAGEFEMDEYAHSNR